MSRLVKKGADFVYRTADGRWEVRRNATGQAFGPYTIRDTHGLKRSVRARTLDDAEEAIRDMLRDEVGS